MDEFDFATTFRGLTGNEPFPWQRALYEQFRSGAFPASCNLPTGLGKTSVIALWLIAVANAGREGHVPRRLVYIVNRRTVVDQATDEAHRLRDRLATVPVLAARLSSLCAVTNDPPLAISTLRG